MRFNSISISNMRLIGDSTRTFCFVKDKNVVILLGDNGFGKTTVLDALATTMSPYPAQFPGISDFLLSDFDVHINRNGKRSKFLKVSAELEDGGQIISSTRYRKGTHTAPKADYERLKQAANANKNGILNEEDIVLPVFAYYGTGRGQFQVPERRRGFQQTFDRWDCYKNAIQPETDFKRFFGWFDLMEDEERRMREKLKDFDYMSPVLQAVRRALSLVVHDFRNPRIETRPLRFIMDRVDSDGSCHELRIEQLSEGYKIVIAMVADLAARMAEANPEMENPLEATGIVLIDEVDLHLHPQWQRSILRQLTEVFPNVQFIVSTHSPVIVVGAADIAQIVNLNTEEQEQVDVSTLNIGNILLGELFGLSSLHSPKWDKMIQERDSILEKDSLDDDDRTRLEELDDKLKDVSDIQDSNAIKSGKLLEKLVQQLNIEL